MSDIHYSVNQVILRIELNSEVPLETILECVPHSDKYKGSVVVSNGNFTCKITKRGFIFIFISWALHKQLSNVVQVVKYVVGNVNNFLRVRVGEVDVKLSNFQITFKLKSETQFVLFCQSFIEVLSSECYIEVREENSSETPWIPYSLCFTSAKFSQIRSVKCKRIPSKSTIQIESSFNGSGVISQFEDLEFFMVNIKKCLTLNLK